MHFYEKDAKILLTITIKAGIAMAKNDFDIDFDFEKEYGFDLYEKEPRRRLGIEDENKISMGAALRHFDICCKEKNISVEYIKKNVKRKHT